MAKIADMVEKISETVTEGYQKIEDGVVGGYKKIETGVVEGFGKVSDKFVDVLLTIVAYITIAWFIIAITVRQTLKTTLYEKVL